MEKDSLIYRQGYSFCTAPIQITLSVGCGEKRDGMELGVFPAMWHLLEKRIRTHPNEARQVDALRMLPIHGALFRVAICVGISKAKHYSTYLSLFYNFLLNYIQKDFTPETWMDIFYFIMQWHHIPAWTAFVQLFDVVMSRHQQCETMVDGRLCTLAHGIV